LSDSGQAPGGVPGVVDHPSGGTAGNDFASHDAVGQNRPSGQLASPAQFDIPADGQRKEGMSKGELQ
jgi:hypothetical protein